MDLLGSILGSMDPIPAPKMDEETKKKVQEAKARANKFKDLERKRKANFKIRIEGEINKLLESGSEVRKVVFEPMDKLHRSITHEVAETAGMSAFSFGEEEVDRHIVVWKKEFTPSEAELQAMRNGEEYDPTKPVNDEKLKADELSTAHVQTTEEKERRKRSHKGGEQEKYFEKYARIVGENSGIDAAHTMKSNKAYGMVSSSNKEDTRSIEETMKQIRERKNQNKMTAVSSPQQVPVAADASSKCTTEETAGTSSSSKS